MSIPGTAGGTNSLDETISNVIARISLQSPSEMTSKKKTKSKRKHALAICPLETPSTASPRKKKKVLSPEKRNPSTTSKSTVTSSNGPVDRFTMLPYSKICDSCGNTFTVPAQYRWHSKCHQRKRIGSSKYFSYFCTLEDCDEFFQTAVSAGNHISSHFVEEDSLFQCTKCLATFLNYHAFDDHYNDNHSVQSQETLNNQIAVMRSCRKNVKKIPDPPLHLTKKVKKRKPPTPDVSDSTDSEDEYIKEVLRDLEEMIENQKRCSDDIKDPNQCIMEWCGKSFPTQAEVMAHLETHFTQPKFGRPQDWKTIIS